MPTNTRHPTECIGEFNDLAALPAFVAGYSRVFDATADMIFDDLVFDADERRADGGNLSDYINTITIFLKHARNAANLTFDAAQAPETGRFCFDQHA